MNLRNITRQRIRLRNAVFVERIRVSNMIGEHL